MAKKLTKRQHRTAWLMLVIGIGGIVSGLTNPTNFWTGMSFGMGIIVLIISYGAFTGRITDR